MAPGYDRNCTHSSKPVWSPTTARRHHDRRPATGTHLHDHQPRHACVWSDNKKDFCCHAESWLARLFELAEAIRKAMTVLCSINPSDPDTDYSLAAHSRWQWAHQPFRPPRHKTSHAHPKVVSRPTTDTLNSSRHMLFREAHKSDQILEYFDFLSSSCEYLRGALSGSPFFLRKARSGTIRPCLAISAEWLGRRTGSRFGEHHCRLPVTWLALSARQAILRSICCSQT